MFVTIDIPIFGQKWTASWVGRGGVLEDMASVQGNVWGGRTRTGEEGRRHLRPQVSDRMAGELIDGESNAGGDQVKKEKKPEEEQGQAAAIGDGTRAMPRVDESREEGPGEARSGGKGKPSGLEV